MALPLKNLAAFSLLLAAGAAAVVGIGTLRPRPSPAERGRRLAESLGCFGCHGPGGIRGAPNPGRTDKTVPGFEGDLMMYAKTRDEVVEWIRDGVTAAKSKSRTWQSQRDKGTLKMPAYGHLVSREELSDLADFVLATATTPEPEDSLALAGRDRAEALGCTGCHGPGGRMARPNPGSLKGYVPSWDGADFAELVHGPREFREWVEKGRSSRFESNPIARYFLDRAAVRMPAFKDHLEPGDLEALWAYIQWLRKQ